MKKIIVAALLAVLLASAACKKNFFEAEPADTPEAVFEQLWQTFDANYGPFAERGIDWDALYAEFRPRVNAQTSDDELHQVLTEMLTRLDDGHVNLIAPGRPPFNANYIRQHKIDDSLFNMTLVRQNYLEPGFKIAEDTGYVYGKIRNERIGYIFFDYVGPNFTVFNEFLDANADSDGIIIDLRHNKGGDFTWCFSEIGRLTAAPRTVFESRTKTGPGPNDFSPWRTWSLEPAGPLFDKPIIVLTDRYTISAGERAVMAFRTLLNANTLGETTCGAQSTAIGGELANGWYYTLATQNTRLFDGQSYEGVGLAPDISFKNTLADVQAGLDKTLERAIEELK